MPVLNVQGDKMEAVVLLGLLGICSFEDVKEREIRSIIVLLGGIVGISFHFFNENQSLLSIVGGLIVGILMLALSVASGEKVGKGDAILIMVTGIYLGFWQNLVLLWAAALMAGVYGFYNIFLHGKNLKSEIPFVPFMLAAYVCLLFMERGALI